MTPLALLAVWTAHAVPVEDGTDARYLVDTRRAAEAMPWFRAHLDSGEATDGDMLRFLEGLGMLPAQRTAALPGLVRAWADDQEEVEAPAVLEAMAIATAALPARTWSSRGLPGSPGPWCDEAQQVIVSEEPATPYARYLLLRQWDRLAGACGWELADPDREVRGALARSGETGDYLHAWFGPGDGTVDDEDRAALERALDDKPPRVRLFGHYFADELEGPAVDAARARLVEEARTLATDDRPSRVWAAATALWAAGQYDEAEAALDRVSQLDPRNPLVERRRLQLRKAAERAAARDEAGTDAPSSTTSRAAEPPGATTILDPRARLDALQAEGPSGSRWERATYWAATAEAAHGVGDPTTELRALRKLLKRMERPDTVRRLVEVAAAEEQDLGAARRFARRWVRKQRRTPSIRDEPASAGEAWREGLAEALAAHATALHATGREGPAEEALEEALVLAPPTSERLLLLGRLYHRRGHRAAVPTLARALADDAVDGPDAEAGWSALEEALVTHDLWAPGGAVGFVDALGPPSGDAREPSEETPLDGSGFEDLTVQIDGEEVRLFDLEGPLVVDVWATWCGPCKESLPHLDGLAREYDGRVTMVALSVDDELEKIDAYLSVRGEPAFTVAWAGTDGMGALGIDGIPAMFVFDAEHRLVAELSGWGPGSRELDRAIERMLR